MFSLLSISKRLPKFLVGFALVFCLLSAPTQSQAISVKIKIPGLDVLPKIWDTIKSIATDVTNVKQNINSIVDMFKDIYKLVVSIPTVFNRGVVGIACNVVEMGNSELCRKFGDDSGSGGGDSRAAGGDDNSTLDNPTDQKYLDNAKSLEAKRIAHAMNEAAEQSGADIALNTENVSELMYDRYKEKEKFTHDENLSATNFLNSTAHDDQQAEAAWSFMQHVTQSNIEPAIPKSMENNPSPDVQRKLYQRRAQQAKRSIAAQSFYHAFASRQNIPGLNRDDDGGSSASGGNPGGFGKGISFNPMENKNSVIDMKEKACNAVADFDLHSKLSFLPSFIGKSLNTLVGPLQTLLGIGCEMNARFERMELTFATMALEMIEVAPIIRDMASGLTDGLTAFQGGG